MVAGSRCFPLCVCLLEDLDNSKQEMHRTTYMLGISVTAWCLPLLLTWTLLHICPERWWGAPISASELTQSRAMPSLLTQFGLSHCTVVIISDPKQQKGVSTKSHNRKPSPPFGILWEKEVQREDKASIHPDFLALRSTLEGKGCVMVIEPKSL